MAKANFPIANLFRIEDSPAGYIAGIRYNPTCVWSKLHNPGGSAFPSFANKNKLFVFNHIRRFVGIYLNFKIVGSNICNFSLGSKGYIPIDRKVFQSDIRRMINRNRLHPVVHNKQRPTPVEREILHFVDKNSQSFRIIVGGVTFIIIAFNTMMWPEIISSFRKIKRRTRLGFTSLKGFLYIRNCIFAGIRFQSKISHRYLYLRGNV